MRVRHPGQPSRDEKREIGSRIQRARLEAGLSQQKVGDHLGVSTRSVQAYEQGEVVPWRHAAALERILGRSKEWLLYGEGSPDGGHAQLHQEIIERLDHIEERLGKLESRE